MKTNHNAVTSHVYSEANQTHLEKHKDAFALSSDQWAGFHQWREVGRKVKKGAKGCRIIMMVDKKVGEAVDTKKPVKQKVPKGRCVFNFEHTEEV